MKANFWVLACLLALLISGSQAALTMRYFKNPAYPGKCYIDGKTILDEGQTITQERCIHTSCGSNGLVELASCGLKGIVPPCRLGERKYPKADYPKCCIHVMHCPDGDGEI